MNKLLTLTVLAGLSLHVFAADIPLKQEEFSPALNKNGLSIEGDTMTLTGRVMLVSKKAFPYSRGKAYGIKGKFKGVPNTPNNTFYIGFILLDAQQQQIQHHHAVIVANTETKLLTDVKPGDTFIMVEDASKWLFKGSFRVAFQATADLSDLPNRNTSNLGVKSIEKTEKGWKVSFSNRAGRTAKAGTLVREHREGGYVYITTGNNGKGVVNPTSKIKAFYRGTKYLKVIILANWASAKKGDQPKLAIKDVCLTEE